MKLRTEDLWRWSGELSRKQFLVWGFILFAVKYNLDRCLLSVFYGTTWSVFSYLTEPLPGVFKTSMGLSPQQLFTLLAASLPFLWIGAVLSIKRLRSAGLPVGLAALFVVPVLKWFLFIALAIVPGKGARPGRCISWLPESLAGSAAIAAGLGACLALAGIALSTHGLAQYGWGLFVGIPFCNGFFGAIIFGANEVRTLRQTIAVAGLSVVLTGVLLLVLAFEGVICLIMAAPLAIMLAIIGAAAGHVAIRVCRSRNQPHLYCLPILAVPLMLGTEYLREAPAPLLKVVTAIEVNAPREKVWKNVVKFAELPPPTESIFKFGIAYPIRAEITGRGPGAVRNCVFSTGPFVEPIEIWNEPELLKFSVTKNPEPMQEWTPYRAIHPPHLNGFLVSRQGQFLLTELPNGRTRLEGTTWYQHTLWPAPYWQIWSDQIIHTIHQRVLNHIKGLAEAEETGLRESKPL